MRKSHTKIKAVGNPIDLEDPQPRSPLHEGHLDMRRKNFTLLLSVVLVCLFASRAHAQMASWTAGFPKPGTNAGEILVEGTSTASGGWTLNEDITVTVWLKGGGSVVAKGGVTINKNTGAWSGTLQGLTSKQTYNISIAITEANGGATNIISPDPKQASAK